MMVMVIMAVLIVVMLINVLCSAVTRIKVAGGTVR